MRRRPAAMADASSQSAGPTPDASPLRSLKRSPRNESKSPRSKVGEMVFDTVRAMQAQIAALTLRVEFLEDALHGGFANHPAVRLPRQSAHIDLSDPMGSASSSIGNTTDLAGASSVRTASTPPAPILSASSRHAIASTQNPRAPAVQLSVPILRSVSASARTPGTAAAMPSNAAALLSVAPSVQTPRGSWCAAAVQQRGVTPSTSPPRTRVEHAHLRSASLGAKIGWQPLAPYVAVTGAPVVSLTPSWGTASNPSSATLVRPPAVQQLQAVQQVVGLSSHPSSLQLPSPRAATNAQVATGLSASRARSADRIKVRRWTQPPVAASPDQDGQYLSTEKLEATDNPLLHKDKQSRSVPEIGIVRSQSMPSGNGLPAENEQHKTEKLEAGMSQGSEEVLPKKHTRDCECSPGRRGRGAKPKPKASASGSARYAPRRTQDPAERDAKHMVEKETKNLAAKDTPHLVLSLISDEKNSLSFRKGDDVEPRTISRARQRSSPLSNK